MPDNSLYDVLKSQRYKNLKPKFTVRQVDYKICLLRPLPTACGQSVRLCVCIEGGGGGCVWVCVSVWIMSRIYIYYIHNLYLCVFEICMCIDTISPMNRYMHGMYIYL